MIKIQYCSDLHLEFKDNAYFIQANLLVPEGEILILAGDIIPFGMIGTVNWFFDFVSDNFQKTYWIPGNHEYYGGDIRDKEFSFIEDIRSNVFLINNHSVIISDTKIIFSTLWSYIWPENILPVKSRLADFGHVQYNGDRFTPKDFNTLHLKSRRFIYNELLDNKIKNQIVVTHHVPTFKNFPPEFINSNINNAFVSELSDIIVETKPKAWIYGHHHRNTPEFNVATTKLLTNQLGYVSYDEGDGFERSATFTISP
jgi:predicted phosphohydrolase